MKFKTQLCLTLTIKTMQMSDRRTNREADGMIDRYHHLTYQQSGQKTVKNFLKIFFSVEYSYVASQAYLGLHRVQLCICAWSSTKTITCGNVGDFYVVVRDYRPRATVQDIISNTEDLIF